MEQFILGFYMLLVSLFVLSFINLIVHILIVKFVKAPAEKAGVVNVTFKAVQYDERRAPSLI
jgi:hypothetical protein